MNDEIYRTIAVDSGEMILVGDEDGRNEYASPATSELLGIPAAELRGLGWQRFIHAEDLPAVMEAHYQALPLVVISADRPSCYRGSGAPQAVEQVGIFGDYVGRRVEMEADADGRLLMTDASGSDDRPIHFNVCLDEGLTSEPSAEPSKHALLSLPPNEPSDVERYAWREFWEAGGELLVLASGIHPQDVAGAREFLLELRAPVIAEATSNLVNDPALAPLIVRGGEKALAAS